MSFILAFISIMLLLLAAAVVYLAGSVLRMMQRLTLSKNESQTGFKK